MRLATQPATLLVLGAIAGGLLGGGFSYWRFGRPTPSAADRWEAFRQAQLMTGAQLFAVQWNGAPMTFVLRDCSVYLAEEASDGMIARTRVLKTGFYLLPTACTSQSLRAGDQFLVAELANRAIGAGGGNTTGGTYRSRDGRAWEKETATGWTAVDEAQ